MTAAAMRRGEGECRKAESRKVEEEAASSNGNAGILSALAPAVMVSAPWAASPYRKKTKDLKKQDTREEVDYASPTQNLEQNIPRAPWDFKSQPHEDVASSRERRLRQ